MGEVTADFMAMNKLVSLIFLNFFSQCRKALLSGKNVYREKEKITVLVHARGYVPLAASPTRARL